ncbi:MAG: hypothetical protein AAB967_01815 [Patescibacteria group bacterium]
MKFSFLEKTVDNYSAILFLRTDVILAPAARMHLHPCLPAGRSASKVIRDDTKLIMPPIVPQLSASEASGYSWRDPVYLRNEIARQILIADRRDQANLISSFTFGDLRDFSKIE